MSITRLLLGLALAASIAAPSFAQEGAPFTRIYKAGERPVYTLVHSITMLGSEHANTFEIALTAGETTSKGKTDLKLKMLGAKTSDPNDKTGIAPEITVVMGAHNMPEKMSPTQGSTDIFELMLLVAGSTTDKPVKVGQEEAWKWEGGIMTFNGTTKVLEVSTEKKQLKALIKMRARIQGQDMADITLTSTYDMTNGSLLSSEGVFETIGLQSTQSVKIVRKAQP